MFKRQSRQDLITDNMNVGLLLVMDIQDKVPLRGPCFRRQCGSRCAGISWSRSLGSGEREVCTGEKYV